jgi:hypothetical protein
MLTGEFRPHKLPRTGEALAWGFVTLALAVQVVLVRSNTPVMPVLRGMLYLLLPVALLISFKNWVDRRTFIRLDEESVTFSNGLQRVTLRWPEIRRLVISHSSLGDGKSVLVMGEKRFFRFETLGHVRQRGREAVYGFEQGDAILQTLVARCGFQRHEEKDGYYYA